MDSVRSADHHQRGLRQADAATHHQRRLHSARSMDSARARLPSISTPGIRARPTSGPVPRAAWDSAQLILNAEAGGIAYYLHVKGYNGENVANGTLDLGPYRYKDAAPTNPDAAVETHGAQDGVWQSTVASPSFTWTGAADDSGIAGYMVYVGAEETGTSATYVTSAAYSSPALETGTYYLRVCAKDNTGSLADEWATLFTFKYDSSAPSTPIVTDDGAYTGSKTKLHGDMVGYG